MPKDQRRVQLLETAAMIVRTQGTDALTLAYLAERAGVTKPIAYEHFGSRAGLLIALYQRFDERQTQAVQAALATEARTLDQAIAILSAAYVDCSLSAGQEFGAIAQALAASEEMEDFRQSLREGYIDRCFDALAPFTDLTRETGEVLLIGLLAAADALSQAAAAGRITRDQAVDALSRTMIGAIGAG
jgi:AcrR family transcriptional regulator